MNPSVATLEGPDLASTYQPRRVWAAGVSIAWNLFLAGSFVFSGAAWWLHQWLRNHPILRGKATIPPLIAYLLLCFIAYAAANYPLELWIGYLEERQFGLAKDGIRAWSRDWLAANMQHGLLFCAGSLVIVGIQLHWPQAWLGIVALAVLVAFLTSSYFAAEMLPPGLFRRESPDAETEARLSTLAGDAALPPVQIFMSSNPRGFCGGIMGMGNRQVMLISRSTITDASDTMLRFVLRHDAGHRYYHHPLVATLAGWAWTMLGLVVSDRIIHRAAPGAFALPPYIAWLALCFSVWMAMGEPLLAYLGRRLEYQADRFYLRHGGTPGELRIALEELSRRNLARLDAQRRRRSFFHPLPSVWNRLHAAEKYARSLPSTASIQTEGVP